MTRLLLVGAGNMAIHHAKVLNELKIDYDVIGRGKESAQRFEEQVGKKVITGGLEQKQSFYTKGYTHALLATDLEFLCENALSLINGGIKQVLIEKPGALSKQDFELLVKASRLKQAKVFVAYNRRFYASILEAQKRIEDDGGLMSVQFEFTEWSHIIDNNTRSPFKLENWFIANSTHVIDTVFFIAGKPASLSTYVQSHLNWHPKGSIFVGAGITEKNIPFSYHSNWESAGSWKMELCTNQTRYIFRPFEKLHIQKRGEVSVAEVELIDEDDIKFKPGFMKQMKAFLGDQANLLPLEDAESMFTIYNQFLSDN